MMLDTTRLRGIGIVENGELPPGHPELPLDHPPVHHPYVWPPMWTEPQTIVVREMGPQVVGSPCAWYEDLEEGGYCKAPATWLIVAGLGVGALVFLGMRK